MGISLSLLALLLSGQALAEEPVSARCEKVAAEFREMDKLVPKACEESKKVHQQFQQAFQEVIYQCRRLEARVNAGATKLKPGTEDEMRNEATEIRRKDMEERYALTDKIAHELLLTPIDTDSPARPPLLVADECRNELDDYAKIRRVTLAAFSRFFAAIDLHDDSLFQQASEKALPAPTAAPIEPGR